MKYISRLTALLLAVMLMVSSAGAMSVDDLTLGTMNMLYESVSEDAYTNLEAGVLGEEYELEAFTDMTNKELYSFQWYDVDGNALPSADNPWCMNATVTMEEQQFYCVATDADNVSLKSAIMVLPAAQITELDEYVGYLSSVALDNDTGLYNKEQIYYFLTNTWNVDSNGINLGAGVVSEWRNEWSDSEWYFDMMCTCVVDGKVEADTCVLYPGTSLHAEGCEWAGEGEVIEPDIPQPPLYYGDPQGNQYIASAEYTLPMNGGRAVILPKGGRAMINANAADGAQWQVSDGVQWIDITGENSASLTITTAKLNTIFELTGVAELRYFNKDSETVLASVSVTSEEIANGEYVEPAAEKLALFAVERAETDKHTIVINYLFSGSGEIVTSPYTATIEKGGNFGADVPNPIVRGYKLAETNDDNLPQGFSYTADKVIINVKNIQEDMTLDVYYEPTQVSYTVIHYKQNINDDNYVEAARETMTGLTKSQVPEVALDSEHRTAANNTGFDPTGFYSLLYEKAAIAADGSTVVEVYYDREYYLLSFDLGGGYGVEPIYARFETPVGVVPDPVRAGYAFLGWSLDGKTVELPDTVPAENGKYKALWSAGTASYTVVYWNADIKEGSGDTSYSYWGQKNVESVAGTVLTPSEVGAEHPAASVERIKDAGYFKYEADVTAARNAQTVTVEGDGSTVVNVYYSRNKYTIRFIYARYDGTKYQLANLTGCGTYNNTWHPVSVGHEYVETSWNSYSTKTAPVVNEAYKDYTGSFKEGNYTYHYIYMTAEYGANLEKIWPAAPLPKTSDYFFGSWGAQCGSPYRTIYGNEHANIVGAYPIMSEELIVNPANPIAQTMVAWWAQSGDNVLPHTYHIYFEALPGEENAEGVKDKDGVLYVPVENIVFTCAHNGTTRVDPFAYVGFECVNDTRVIEPDHQSNSNNYAKKDGAQYACPNNECDYCNVFYYKRDRYNLSFFNHNEASVAPADQTLMFGQSFSSYNPGEPNYPVGLEKGAYEFAGWYTTADTLQGTEVKWDENTMPAGNLTVYAKWQPVTHDVHFYLDKDDMENNRELEDGALTQTVFHGTILTEDQVPGHGTNGGLTFIGWFYEEDGVEKAIDFESMPITQDLKVYGKWSSNILKEYTVYFKIKGEDTEIADPINGSTLAGMTKTFDAKGGEELKPEYREGYFPEVKSHSLTLSIDDANNTGANTFTFWYVPKVAVPYIVRYWVQEADGTTKMQEQVLHSDNKKAVVTETFKVFTGYMPDAYQKRLVISEEALGEGEEWIKVNGVLVHPDNVINFYYKKDEVNAYYKVSHWLEPLTGSNWTEYGTGTQAQGKINITQLKAEDFDLALDGYTFDVARTECIYGGVETSKEVVGNGSVTLPQEGLELKLYYVRNEYPYEIRHVELNTGVMLEQTETGKARYGDTKSGAPKTIPGYTYKQVNPQEGQISIRVEKSDTVKLNIITYYYVENDVEIKYVGVAPNGTTFDVCGTLSADAETVKVMSGTALGSTAAAKLPAFKFVGWYDKDKKLLSTEARYVPGKTAKISVYDAATDTYVEKDAYESATYYAKFEWKLADLSITKKVVEEVGFKAPEGTEFAFTVKLTGVLPSNTISVSIGDTTTQTEKSMTLDENNVLAFSLTDGQTAVIHDLPVGTEYEVEETVPFNYTVRYDGNETGAIPENGVETLVTNFYPLRYGELTVTKAGLSKDNESAIVDVVITTNKVKTTYTLVLNKDNPTATIAKIQVGSTYTVTERTGWTWLYSDGPAYDKAAGTIGDEPTTCTITNHSYSDQWMHDESYLVNNFGTGSNAGVNE